ncbi:Prolyl 4-hydroxylase 1 [Venturia nashicola]|nr:Prolyl 4-hydroxylase 1 [Venturia nashicola]
MKREQIPDYLPAIFTENYLPKTFKTQNVSLATQYEENGCPTLPMSVQIFSLDPLVIYIRNFLSPSERAYLKILAEPDFEPSTISSDSSTDPSIRSSYSAILESDDAVVTCIARRAAKFQGHIRLSKLEPLQVVRYFPGESFKFHNDWDIDEPPGKRRSSTFFAYVGCEECVGGSTRFYHLSRNGTSKRWCDVVDCTERALKGVKFLPIEGNAIFWENLKDGVGIEEVLHAGTTLEKGVKYGLNIWTRETSEWT